MGDEEMTAEKFRERMTTQEWEKVFSMSQDKNLYSNLCSSLFPTIHGQYCPVSWHLSARLWSYDSLISHHTCLLSCVSGDPSILDGKIFRVKIVIIGFLVFFCGSPVRSC